MMVLPLYTQVPHTINGFSVTRDNIDGCDTCPIYFHFVVTRIFILTTQIYNFLNLDQISFSFFCNPVKSQMKQGSLN